MFAAGDGGRGHGRGRDHRRRHHHPEQGARAAGSDADRLARPDRHALAAAVRALPFAKPLTTIAAAGTQLLVRNRCNQPVNLWMVYEGANGLEYSGYGMWTYAPGESSFAAYNSQNTRPINDNILFYAESTDGTVNWNGDRNMDFNGRILAMRKADIATDSDGNYVLELNCSSS